MLSQLWKNRRKPAMGTAIWFKEWAKRLWTFPSLLNFCRRVLRLKWQGARIGSGSVLSALRLNGRPHLLQIGQNSFIGRVEMQLEATVEIGSMVCINDGVKIMTASHDVQDPAWGQVARPIRILDYAWIATGAVLLPGVTIGRGSVVGAHAVVSKDVPDYAIAVGNPVNIRENARARELRYSPTRFLTFQAAWREIPN
jgi:maltose O-acetyltransferase